ncbi:hypothetical protein Cadr_000004312 [Camelus dromedarius]|uniref:Uncharacterized protein n=1 Tax=Camelus dromedarius TaxID=9838 RepID=A0A5N4ECK5_CAMDR|nr:hypothetical protein Cadr_000004312 [Camelus dromedarius]
MSEEEPRPACGLSPEKLLVFAPGAKPYQGVRAKKKPLGVSVLGRGWEEAWDPWRSCGDRQRPRDGGVWIYYERRLGGTQAQRAELVAGSLSTARGTQRNEGLGNLRKSRAVILSCSGQQKLGRAGAGVGEPNCSEDGSLTSRIQWRGPGWSLKHKESQLHPASSSTWEMKLTLEMQMTHQGHHTDWGPLLGRVLCQTDCMGRREKRTRSPQHKSHLQASEIMQGEGPGAEVVDGKRSSKVKISQNHRKRIAYCAVPSGLPKQPSRLQEDLPRLRCGPSALGLPHSPEEEQSEAQTALWLVGKKPASFPCSLGTWILLQRFGLDARVSESELPPRVSS